MFRLLDLFTTKTNASLLNVYLPPSQRSFVYQKFVYVEFIYHCVKIHFIYEVFIYHIFFDVCLPKFIYVNFVHHSKLSKQVKVTTKFYCVRIFLSISLRQVILYIRSNTKNQCIKIYLFRTTCITERLGKNSSSAPSPSPHLPPSPLPTKAATLFLGV